MTIPKERLRFVFQGYAIWYELEQFPTTANTLDGVVEADTAMLDLEQALWTAAKELSVGPIPAPHLTALYGINHLSEGEVRQRFHDLSLWLRQQRNDVEEWLVLEPSGFLSDVEVEGVNGGQMVRSSSRSSTIERSRGQTVPLRNV
jgi:hypothetical protein